MSVNEASAREALKIRKQYIAWVKWARAKDMTTTHPHPPHPDDVYHANSVLAAFAAEILERNP